MPFTQKYKLIQWEIQTALEDIEAPCICHSIYEKEEPGNIYKDIEEEIKKADLIIADITSRNLNVYWELGYAHRDKGCERCIILKQIGSSVPFDLRRYRVFEYEDSEAGVARLRKMIVRIVKNVIKSEPQYSCA